MKASNELKAFLQDWLNWAEGRNSEFHYNPCVGLCANSERFDIDLIIREELGIMFNWCAYPFGEDHYDERMFNDTQHQDTNRLAWVKAALNDTLDTWELME